METKQMEFWKGKFGEEYTERNTYSVAELDEKYVSQFGISRSDMNRKFLSPINPQKILEVGCNTGNILRNLQSLGYDNLYGIELQAYAIEKAKTLCNGINLVQGSAFDLPFKDNYFDLVYTSGVLIHINPDDLEIVMREMYRVSNSYIWGFEYYMDEMQHIEYHGNSGKMWKGNYANKFMQLFPDLTLVQSELYKYRGDENRDQMFLLKKSE
jgi:pseudaminic acid biosynthesis-associated methylase